MLGCVEKVHQTPAAAIFSSLTLSVRIGDKGAPLSMEHVEGGCV